MAYARHLKRATLFGVAGIALAAGTAAYAQEERPAASPQAADDTSESEEDEDTIVVTGTLIRGIAPPGAQTLTMDKEEAIATGATSTAQLLANIPQLGDFNQRPINRGVFNTQQTVNHPDLRNLGQAVLGGGGSATLLLMDGHRLPGMGVRQTIPDSDAIAPGAIERIEIVTDGGSAIYGADAVGGVVNYITRKRFDGVQANASYGFAPDYQTASADITAGVDWGKVSLWGTYSFNWHDEIYARDRDYVQNLDWQNGVGNDLTCTPGNAIITPAGTPSPPPVTYALPNFVKGLGNRCDNLEDSTIYPYERRHSVLVGLTQTSEHLEVEFKAFYTNRVNWSDGGPLTGSAQIAANNPFYRSSGDSNAGRTQTINLNFIPVLGNSSDQRVELNTWGMSFAVTGELGGGWRARGLFNYGFGQSEVLNDMVNNTAFQAAVTAGTINPYDLAAPGNATALAVVTDWANYGLGKNELTNYRAVVDGPLFALPGGDVSLAAGAEYIVEDFKVTSGVGLASNLLRPRGRGERNTKALFGEIFMLIFGEGNRSPGLYSLAISAAGRYDDYSDFGGTFNPKFALTYEPVEWIKLRGNWGKSFQAPSLADAQAAVVNAITVLPGRVITAHPNFPAATGQSSVFLSGGGADLKPQKAKIWSVGADLEPPFIPGLSLSGTYYKITFNDLIAVPPVTSTLIYTAYSHLVQLGPPGNPLTRAQLEAFAALAPANNSQLIPFFTRPQDVYFLIDGRRANFSVVKTSGIDFSARYDRRTSFGSIYARVSGNYVLTRDDSPLPGLPFIDNVDNFTRLRMSSTLGATVGGFRAQATWLHSGGFDIVPTATNLQQSHVSAYNTVNLFFQYDFEGEKLFKDLSLTLNIDNLFNQDPPIFRGTQAGNGNGFTLGRLIQAGIRKRF